MTVFAIDKSVFLGYTTNITTKHGDNMTVKTGYFTSIGHIQDANKNGGRYFFEPAAMRGFRSRIHNAVYGGCVFVTSEQFSFRGRTEPRQYRVRVAMADGSIRSVMGKFKSRDNAHENAKWLGESLRNGLVSYSPTTCEFTYHSAYGDSVLGDS